MAWTRRGRWSRRLGLVLLWLAGLSWLLALGLIVWMLYHGVPATR